MNTDWRTYCNGDGLTVCDGTVEVHFENGRSQKVEIEDESQIFRLRSVVARRAVVEGIPDAALLASVRNRSVCLVGFRLDERGRMIAEARLPKAGLSRDEFQLILHHLASEADRFEFQLTGQDRE